MISSYSSSSFSLPFPHDEPSKLAQTLPALLSRNGFVRLDGVFSPAEVAQMKEAMGAVVDGLDPEAHPRTTFNTSDEEKHVSDQYFLKSADKVRFFYEEGAVEQGSGKLLVPKDRALNKVGHALHWLEPTFRRFTFHERIKDIIRALGAESPRVAQSMYIFKQPRIGGAANEHVDSTFLHTKHPADNLLGIWIALDHAKLENGCLWFIPGSHKADLAEQTKHYKFVRNKEALADSKGEGPLLKFVGTRPTFDGSQFVPVECESGSLLLIHGDVVHKSEANTSNLPRHIFTFHLVDLDRDGGTWNETNWLQETENYKFPALFDN